MTCVVSECIFKGALTFCVPHSLKYFPEGISRRRERTGGKLEENSYCETKARDNVADNCVTAVGGLQIIWAQMRILMF